MLYKSIESRDFCIGKILISVSSRDSIPQKEVAIVNSGAVEYERLQQPVETTRRSFTPRSQSSSSSNPPEVSRSSRTRGESSKSGPTERRTGGRFPKRDNIDDDNTAKPASSSDENVTRRSFSRLRGNPTSSSQTVKNPGIRQPATRASLRNVPETVPTTEAAELRPRAPEATRSSKSLPDLRSRTGGEYWLQTPIMRSLFGRCINVWKNSGLLP